MTLTEALKWAHKLYLEGHYSDGCTYAPDFGIKRFCYMHDFLRRFKPIPARQADYLFFQGICTKGYHYYPVAVVYWLAVRVTYLIGVYK